MDNNQASSDIDREADLMTLAIFAEKNRLKVMRDGRGDPVILGKQGNLYGYSTTELGVMFMPPAPRLSLGVDGARSLGATSSGQPWPLA